MKTQQNVFLIKGDYVRTPEDDEKDRAEAGWKKEQADKALKIFLSKNPSGRVIPRNTH